MTTCKVDKTGKAGTEGKNQQKHCRIRCGPVCDFVARYRRMRIYEQLSIPLSVLTLIAVIVAGVIYYCQLRTMIAGVDRARDTAEAAKVTAETGRKELELSERPWVSVDVSIAKPLVFDPQGGTISLRWVLKNVGHSPAAGTAVVAKLRFWNPPTIDLDKEQKALCGPIHDLPDLPGVSRTMGDTLFPTDQETKTRQLSFDTKDVELGIVRTKNAKPVIIPAIVGCVDYQFEFAPGHHQTGFIRIVAVPNPSFPKSFQGIEPYKPVPGDIALFPYFLGNGVTD
jgi:hypothetical protein